MSAQRTNRIINMLPSLLISAFVLAYLVIGYQTLEVESRQVPVMTAWITLFLLALDLYTSWKGGNEENHKKDEVDYPLFVELRAPLSLLALIIMIYFVGFYIGGSIYLVLALSWLGGQRLRFSVITTVLTFLSLYLLFEKGLSFQLFRGVLFAS